MTTDKVFILLLVIMLPLTGCLDMTDNAEAETDTTADTVTSLPMIHSLQIEANSNATLYFDGSTTMKIETMYFQGGDYMQSTNTIFWGYMTCEDNNTLQVRLSSDLYLPVLGGQECSILIEPNSDTIILFSEANLASL